MQNQGVRVEATMHLVRLHVRRMVRLGTYQNLRRSAISASLGQVIFICSLDMAPVVGIKMVCIGVPSQLVWPNMICSERLTAVLRVTLTLTVKGLFVNCRKNPGKRRRV